MSDSCYVQAKLLYHLTLDGQDNTTMRKSKEKLDEPTPVIAVRVPELLRQRIRLSAAQSQRTMSEEMAWLLESAFKWQQALGDRDEMLAKARQLLHEASEHARRIPGDRLELELRRQNWRPNGQGAWEPPKVHKLPPNGFLPETNAETEATPTKKRKAR
jgi:hypothetical protein